MATTVTQDYAAVEWYDDAIDVRRVEEGLARLRQEAAGSGTGARTDVLNLIVYTEDEESARNVSRTLASLSSRHPSRSVIIIADAAAGGGIGTRLSAHCHLAPGLERQVCCEEVFLTVRPRGAAWLRSIILPLLIPDLPVFLWWDAALPPKTDRLASMAQTADRLLLDSLCFGRPAADLRRLVSLVRRLGGACALGDLTWTRLKPWRQVIAQVFQGPALRSYLAGLDEVHVEYAADPERPGPVTAGLLLGWLASRLRWRREGRPTDGQYTFRRGRQRVHCRLHAVAFSALEAGSILSCRLLACDEAAEVRADRLEDPQLLCVRLRAPDTRMESTARIPGTDAAQLLTEELQGLGPDRVYEEALSTAADLLSEGRRSG